MIVVVLVVGYLVLGYVTALISQATKFETDVAALSMTMFMWPLFALLLLAIAIGAGMFYVFEKLGGFLFGRR